MECGEYTAAKFITVLLLKEYRGFWKGQGKLKEVKRMEKKK